MLFQRMLKKFKGAHPPGGPHVDVVGDDVGRSGQQQQQHPEEGGGAVAVAVVPDFVGGGSGLAEKNGMRNLLRGRRPSSPKKGVSEEPSEDTKYHDDGDGPGVKKMSAGKKNRTTFPIDDVVKPLSSSSRGSRSSAKHRSGGSVRATMEGRNTPTSPARSTYSDRSSLVGAVAVDAVRPPTKTAAAKPVVQPSPSTRNKKTVPRRAHSSPLTSSSIDTASDSDAAAAWAQFIQGESENGDTTATIPPDSVARATPIPPVGPTIPPSVGVTAANPRSPTKKTVPRASPTELMDRTGTSLFPPRLPRRIASMNSVLESVGSVHSMAETIISTFEDPRPETPHQRLPLVDDRRGPPRTPRRQPSVNTTLSPSQSETIPEDVKVNLESLAQTQFPDFWDSTGVSLSDSIPGVELTDVSRSNNDGSDAEGAANTSPDRYRTKEDEDVAVFINLVKRMPLSSLLHLLQGHVYSQKSHFSEEYLTQFTAALTQKSSYNVTAPQDVYSNSRKKDGTRVKGILKKFPNKKNGELSASKGRSVSPQSAAFPSKKHFRWAEVTNQHVRTVVKEVECRSELDDHRADIWWTVDELQSIRQDLLVTVHFFRLHRLSYVQSIEVLCRHSPDPDHKQTKQETAILESHMKAIMSEEHSFARGLETHICKLLSDHRRATVKAVLEEQNECRTCDDDIETTEICLREQSLAYSGMSGRFAHSLGRCDHIDALKANLSSWTTSG